MRHPGWCPRANRLAQEKAFYCSSFVRHVFGQAGVNLASGIDEKNTAPEHIARSALPHTKWILARGEAPASRVRKLSALVHSKLKKRP